MENNITIKGSKSTKKLHILTKDNLLSDIIRNKYLYILMLPGIAFYIIFCYLPMIGVVIAFKDFNLNKGILGSNWNGLKNFEFFFTSGDWLRVTTNTLYINILTIAVNTIMGLFFAILINEISSKYFKKISQSMMFLPYFISWVVVSLMAATFLDSQTGVVNKLLISLGKTEIDFYASPEWWRMLLVIFNAWKWTGFNVIIYMAAITGIDAAYYEAATVDGATKLQQVLKITLPLMRPTVVILTLMAIGRIFYGDFGMIYSIIGDNGVLFPTTDVIDTYVFRSLRQLMDMGMTAAVGLYQSVMGLIIILISNFAVKKYDPGSELF